MILGLKSAAVPVSVEFIFVFALPLVEATWGTRGVTGKKNITFSRGGNFYFLYYQSIRLNEHNNFDYWKFKIGMIGKEKNEDPKSTKFEAEFQKPDTLVPRYTVLKRKTIVTTCISSVLQ